MQVEMFKGQHHDVYNILRNKINKGKENEREREREGNRERANINVTNRWESNYCTIVVFFRLLAFPCTIFCNKKIKNTK